MASCDYCRLVEKKDVIYEDDDIVAALHPTPASLGHTVIIPKEHSTIIEQVPDYLVGRMFVLANSLSTTLFQLLNAHGTNIIVENGVTAGQDVPHFSINVIPRSENDGMGFNWMPTQISEDEMSTVELQLKEQTEKIGEFETEKKGPIPVDKEEEVIPNAQDDDYMIRQLRRIP